MPNPAFTANAAVGRRSLLAGVGAAGLAALVGCNNNTGGAKPSGAGGGTGAAKLTGALQVWGGVPGESGPDALCRAFEQANPGTKINYTRYVNDDAGNVKLDTALSGGTPIDVFVSYAPPALFKRISNGLAVDLSDKLAADPDLKQFAPGADPAANFFANGKAYSVPAQKSPSIVFLNQAKLDQAGIKLGDSWTIDEFNDVAKELTGGGVFGTMLPVGRARLTLGPDMNYADGGKRSNYSNPLFAQDMQARLDMQAAKLCMDQKTILAEKLDTFTQSVFLGGRVAMLPSQIFITRYVSNTKEYPHDFLTTAMPYPTLAKEGDKWNEVAIGDHLSINAKSKVQDLAWAFVKFWMANGGKYLIAGGRIPALAGNATPTELTASLLGADAAKVFDVKSFEHALFGKKQNVPVDTIFTAATQLATIRKKWDDEVLLGTKTIPQWVEGITREADAAIAAAK